MTAAFDACCVLGDRRWRQLGTRGIAGRWELADNTLAVMPLTLSRAGLGATLGNSGRLRSSAVFAPWLSQPALTCGLLSVALLQRQ